MLSPSAMLLSMGFPSRSADWERYGRGAGMIRNKQIIADADVVIAFWDGASKGTKNSVELARKAKKKLAICYI